MCGWIGSVLDILFFKFSLFDTLKRFQPGIWYTYQSSDENSVLDNEFGSDIHKHSIWDHGSGWFDQGNSMSILKNLIVIIGHSWITKNSLKRKQYKCQESMMSMNPNEKVF